MRHRAQEGHGRGHVRALRAGGRGRARRLRRATAGGADGERGAQPAALPVGAGPDARTEQAGDGAEPAAAGAAPRAGQACRPSGPGAARGVAGRRSGRGFRGRRRPGEGGAGVTVLLIDDHTEVSRQALTLARKFGEPQAVALDSFSPFAPDALAAAIALLNPSALFAAGTERGNEVMARVAARMGLPFAAKDRKSTRLNSSH